MNRVGFCACVAALALFAPWAVGAAESYDNCTGFITSVPATIATQGVWCLKQDLATAITSGVAITVNANNVTIDCNDYKLGNLAAGIGTQTSGIGAYSRLNTTVRHCNIRGFKEGVVFGGLSGGGHLIEDNRFDNNTRMAIGLYGDGSVVRRNRVFDTGQGTGSIQAFGIYAEGEVDIQENLVAGVAVEAGSNGFTFGIDVHGYTCRIHGNSVRGVLKDGTGASYAIIVDSSLGRSIVTNNSLIGDGTGIGISCDNAINRAKDNVIAGFATTMTGCGDAGGNDQTP